MAEALHGIERWAFNFLQSFDWVEARARYLILMEYINRRERRSTIYDDAEGEKKKLKRAPKHADRKVTQVQAGRQSVANSSRYSHVELTKRFSEDELKSNAISAVLKRGTTARQKEHAEKMKGVEVRQRRQKLSKEGYQPITLEEYASRAEQTTMAYDEQWVRDRSPEAIEDNKIAQLTKTPFWNQLTIAGGFFPELKSVFPSYFAIVTKQAKGRRVTKKAVMKGTSPVELSLPEYLTTLLKLSEGKPAEVKLSNLKKVTNVSNARELMRAKITGRDLLLELVKFDDSEVLERKEREKEEAHGLMRDVIEKAGTEHSQDPVFQVPDANIKSMRCTYRHPVLVDPDDEEWLGPTDDDDDVPEPELERLSEG